ncbi:hypothetical protein NKG94_28360 [Micromonospora sp. M12]
MTDLERGVYEHLITHGLATRLQHVDPALIQHHKLDPADAHHTLARHIATLAARALQPSPAATTSSTTRSIWRTRSRKPSPP